MIRRLIDGLMGKTQTGRTRKRLGRRREFGPEAHAINPDLVDDRANQVVQTLKSADHDAYIVGGAVRDLLLGLKPKDFDVATSATPEEVKKLFRRAFIIGRRFRIVHVVFGRGRQHDVIEVTTFRAFLDNDQAEHVTGNERTAKARLAKLEHAVDDKGRVLRDNVWGSQDEDAARRDFTINGLYYDPQSRVVVDYHGGMADMQQKRIAMIGDPLTRYREDPVRVLRAVRFGAKLARLGFTLTPKTAKPLRDALPLLAEVPQSRLFDEMLKLVQTGHALASIEQLKKLGLARGIYPLLDLIVERADEGLIKAALQDTDRRVAEGKPVVPSFLLACVLWQDVRQGWQLRLKRDENVTPALHDAIDEVFDGRIGEVSGRGKLAADMREIWLMQPRFERQTGKSPFNLADQSRFRAGFDFLRLRADVGEVPEELVDWWQAFSLADESDREGLVHEKQLERQRNQKPRRTGPKGADALDASAQAEKTTSEDAPAPRKRRRRSRRKPRSADSTGNANTGQKPDDTVGRSDDKNEPS